VASDEPRMRGLPEPRGMSFALMVKCLVDVDGPKWPGLPIDARASKALHLFGSR
jgi:hypothetical protein